MQDTTIPLSSKEPLASIKKGNAVKRGFRNCLALKMFEMLEIKVACHADFKSSDQVPCFDPYMLCLV